MLRSMDLPFPVFAMSTFRLLIWRELEEHEAEWGWRRRKKKRKKKDAYVATTRANQPTFTDVERIW